MKRSKQDAADRFFVGLDRLVREYKATKDAPEVPRNLRLLVEEAQDEWPTCNHQPRCSHRGMHESQKLLDKIGREKAV